MKLKNRERIERIKSCVLIITITIIRRRKNTVLYFYFTILFLTITLLAIHKKIQSNNTTIKKLVFFFIYFDIFGYCICRFIYFKIPLENKQIETKRNNITQNVKRNEDVFNRIGSDL